MSSPGATQVLIVGAGPAGMAAAVAASRSGAQVTVIDDNPAPGGQIWRASTTSHRKPRDARRWLRRFRTAAPAFINGAQVISADPQTRTLLIETPESIRELRYEKLILATGARELFLPFPGWTLPGIAGAGGFQALVKGGLPIRGKTVIVAGSGPLLLAVAAYLRRAGARVPLIAEQASAASIARFGLSLLRSPSKIFQAAALRSTLRGIPYRTSCWVESAAGTDRLERVQLRRGRTTWTEPCDYAAISYGLYPNTELAALLGCRIATHTVAVDEWQQTSIPDIFCVGESTGIGGVDLSLVEGEIAGYAAAGHADTAQKHFRKRAAAQRFARALNTAFALRPDLKQLPQPETLICRCEDVAFARLQSATSFRAAKLHTRCGMGPCQARICGPALEFLFGWTTESVRPPVLPCRLGSLSHHPDMPS